MNRTSIVLPESLKFQAQQLALKRRISLAELIRLALEAQIRAFQVENNSELFFRDHNFFEGQAPSDLSEHHDDYLY